MYKQKILITGGAGFVGSLLVPSLLKEGCSINVLDWFIFKKDVFDHLQTSDLKCIKGDIRDRDTIKQSLEGVETVIHLAAISNDPSSELNPKATQEINLDATCKLADISRACGVKRFINASSASVYGIREGNPAVEDCTPNPITLYSKCKLESERYILSLNDHDFITTSLRPATLSGYAPRLRLDLTVNILTYHAVSSGVITVFGGEQYRPNLSVKDMVQVYKEFIRVDSSKIAGRTFNISQDNFKVIEIARRIQSKLNNIDIEVKKIPSEDKRSYSLDASRIARELGFKPAYNIEDSIQELANKLLNGLTPAPSHYIYRNVELLKRTDFTHLL
jgi:nucleoside-diphosphate-sugar epimerase